MYCTVCGNQFQAEAAFCARCGSSRPVAPAAAPPQPPRQSPDAGAPWQAAAQVPQQPQVPQPPTGQVAYQPQASAQPPATHQPAPAGRGRSWLPALVGAGAMALVAGLVAVALVLTGVVALGERRHESAGYASPEAAVTAYLEAMKAGDVDAMAATFAAETWVEHVDLKAYVARINAYTIFGPIRFPGGEQNDQLNLRAREAEIGTYLTYQYITLSGPDWDVSQTLQATGTSADDIYARLRTTFDGTAFTGVRSWELTTLAAYDPARAETFASEGMQKNIDSVRGFLGADELAYPVVRLQAGDGAWVMFPETVRYGDRWWLGSMSGQTANLLAVPAFAAGLLKA